MKKKSIINILIALLAFLPIAGYSQTNKDSALTILTRLVDKYNNTDYLSFNIEYTYRDDAKPTVVLDSLFGGVRMNKESYHLVLGNTETIHNKVYNLILFKEDSLMYISKSLVGKIASNPVSVLDSMLTKIKDVEISLTIRKNVQIITLNFPEGMDYKSAEFVIDEKTGYLLRARYKVNEIEMLDPMARNNTNNMALINKWGIVQSHYSRYQTGAFNNGEFDEKKYFIKTGTDFKPTDAYKQYKIFLASPGL
jgi:hypothetical protein